MPIFKAWDFYERYLPQVNRMRRILWVGDEAMKPLSVDEVLPWIRGELELADEFLASRIIPFGQLEKPQERSKLGYRFAYAYNDVGKTLFTVMQVRNAQSAEAFWLPVSGRNRLEEVFASIQSDPKAAASAAERIARFAKKELLYSSVLTETFEVITIAAAVLQGMRMKPVATDPSLATFFMLGLLKRCQYAADRLPDCDFVQHYATA